MTPPTSLIGTIKTEIFPFSIITHFGDFQGDVVWKEIRDLYGDSDTPVSEFDCMEKHQVVNNRGYAGGYCWHMSPETVVIWIADANDKGSIAHETFHAVYWLLSNLGIQLTPDTNEVYAYHIGWITEKIQSGLRAFWDTES